MPSWFSSISIWTPPSMRRGSRGFALPSRSSDALPQWNNLQSSGSTTFVKALTTQPCGHFSWIHLHCLPASTWSSLASPTPQTLWERQSTAWPWAHRGLWKFALWPRPMQGGLPCASRAEGPSDPHRCDELQWEEPIEDGRNPKDRWRTSGGPGSQPSRARGSHPTSSGTRTEAKPRGGGWGNRRRGKGARDGKACPRW